MASRQILCTIKAGGLMDGHVDRYITHVGGPDFGVITEEQAINDIEHHTHYYFVSKGGHVVSVLVEQGKHRKFLKTEADGYVPNNLVSLPNCK